MRYSNYVDELLSNILKNNGYNYYTIPNIAKHGKFIKDNKLQKSINLYYYSYNINIPPIKPGDFCVNIN